MSAQSLDELLSPLTPNDSASNSTHYLPMVAIGLGLFGFFASGGLYLYYLQIEKTIPFEVIPPTASESATLLVDVSGAVTKPGLYQLPLGSRLNDALLKAEGLSNQADTLWVAQSLNLAQALKDGQKIYIPPKGQTHLAGQVSGATNGDSSGVKISLNQATAVELEMLPEVGPATAAQIIKARTDKGPFQDWQQVEAVPGIGPKMLEQLKENATL